MTRPRRALRTPVGVLKSLLNSLEGATYILSVKGKKGFAQIESSSNPVKVMRIVEKLEEKDVVFSIEAIVPERREVSVAELSAIHDHRIGRLMPLKEARRISS